MTYKTYTASGPFTNGAAPGLSATVFNNIESMLSAGWFDSAITSDGLGGIQPLSLKPTHNTSIAGTTAGTATLYQFLQGTLKGLLVYFNGYRNSTATEQRISLPVAFSARGLYLAGNVPAPSIWLSGSQVANQLQGVNALGTSGGTPGGYTSFHAYDFGEATSAFDQIGCGVSQGSNTTGTLFVIGI